MSETLLSENWKHNKWQTAVPKTKKAKVGELLSSCPLKGIIEIIYNMDRFIPV